LGSALLSIPSVKALRIGDDIFENDGFSSHDSPYLNGDKLMYRSNKCGGIEAGISNGEIIKLNFHCKPLPTVFPGNESFNLRSGAASRAITQRSDTCAVASIGVIAEAVSALTLTELLTKRYGEEHIDLIANNIENFNSFNSDKKLRIDEDVYKKKQ
jgi:chorismate synthase